MFSLRKKSKIEVGEPLGTCVVHGKKYYGNSIKVVNDEDVYVDGILQTDKDGITIDQKAYNKWIERKNKPMSEFSCPSIDYGEKIAKIENFVDIK